MKYLVLLAILIANNAFAESPAMPYKSDNPICQSELTERENVWSKEYERMVSDIVVNLHLASLMELRKLAISEQSISTLKLIDEKVSEELLHTLKFRPKALNYKSQLQAIKSAIELEPLMVGSNVREDIDRAFEVVGV